MYQQLRFCVVHVLLLLSWKYVDAEMSMWKEEGDLQHDEPGKKQHFPSLPQLHIRYLPTLHCLAFS